MLVPCGACGGRHARYDAVRRDAIDAMIEHQRGLRFNYDPLFNCLVPESWSGLIAGAGFQPEETGIALARTGLRWRPMPVNATPIRFTLQPDPRLPAAGRLERRHRPDAAGRAGVGAAGR
ncbi:MAG TPA: hypothetical protein VN969_19420 [Streptosporangiaceae bacterium]|nr:hypothetical protein [Streptosporangiaceae bacterium]